MKPFSHPRKITGEEKTNQGEIFSILFVLLFKELSNQKLALTHSRVSTSDSRKSYHTNKVILM